MCVNNLPKAVCEDEWPGLEPATSRLQVRRSNHYVTSVNLECISGYQQHQIRVNQPVVWSRMHRRPSVKNLRLLQQLMQIRLRQNAVIGHVLRHNSRTSRLQKHRCMDIHISLDHREIRLFALQGAQKNDLIDKFVHLKIIMSIYKAFLKILLLSLSVQ